MLTPAAMFRLLRSAGGVARRRLRPVTLLVPIMLADAAMAQGRFVEDVEVSRNRGGALIEIRLGCTMRYIADVPTEAGVLLEVRLAPFDECRSIASGIASEMLQPANGRLAGLVEIEYDSLGIGDGLLLLRFDRPVSYRVNQRGDLRTLRIEVELPDTSSIRDLPDQTSAPDAGGPAAAVVPPPDAREPVAALAPEPEAARGAGRDRAPLREPRVPEVATVAPGAADYMINLLSTRDAADLDNVAGIAVAENLHLYVSQIDADGVTWHRLRLGFFASEAEAEKDLSGLRERFPRAWIGRAGPEEIQYARESGLERGRRSLAVFTEPAAPEATALEAESEPLPEARVAQLEREGREAMLDQDYAAAIAAYAQLVAAPGEHRPAAREFLGLAYERRGEIERARAEYRRYLEEFPAGADAVRVRQRLAGLALRGAEPAEPLRNSAPDRDDPWQFSTGLAQYYRRSDNRFDPEQPEITTLSALFTDLDFYLGRSGRKVDFATRISASHMRDLLDGESAFRGDQQRVSYAYMDIGASSGSWSTRLGRQSLHTWGVLGRFDGLHFEYDWNTGRELHFTAGHPVESTRDAVATNRSFYGVAIEFGDVFGDWDLATFVNSQTIDGIEARNAVGTELRYFDERRSFTGMVDYDVDFGELNTLLVLGTWRFPNRLTFSMLLDDRLSPTLTARNALIGQPVGTIDELLLVWTDEEIRQIAVDRTAESQTVTLGVAAPLAARLQLNLDITRAELSGTIESAGVAAVPEVGTQVFASASLVGTGLFKGGDVNIFNLRVGESDTYRTGMLTWDSRFPIGRRVRINPRLRYSVWEGLVDGRQRTVVSPMLRLLMNTRNHYRIELEAGVERQLRTEGGTDAESEATGRFVNFGYRANFQ